MLHGPNGALTFANIAQENTYTAEGRQICLGTWPNIRKRLKAIPSLVVAVGSCPFDINFVWRRFIGLQHPMWIHVRICDHTMRFLYGPDRGGLTTIQE
jgi:hypothetical protein